jgi:hypothetical protein
VSLHFQASAGHTVTPCGFLLSPIALITVSELHYAQGLSKHIYMVWMTCHQPSAHSPCTFGAFASCVYRRIRLLICFGACASFTRRIRHRDRIRPTLSFGAFARTSRRIRRVQSTHPSTHMSAHSLVLSAHSPLVCFGAFARQLYSSAHSPGPPGAFARPLGAFANFNGSIRPFIRGL